MKLFEFGNIYELTDPRKSFHTDGYKETRHLGIFLTGNKTKENWIIKQERSSFYQLKGTINTIFQRLGFQNNKFSIETSTEKIFEEGLSIKHNSKNLASFGLVNSKIRSGMEIEQEVFFGFINWDNLLNELSQKVQIRELPKYPEVRRDLALILDKGTKFEEIESLAFQVERKYLKSANLFDVFQSEKLGTAKQSYAVSFVLQDESKTLNDKQIDKIMAGLISAFRDKLGAELR